MVDSEHMDNEESRLTKLFINTFKPEVLESLHPDIKLMLKAYPIYMDTLSKNPDEELSTIERANNFLFFILSTITKIHNEELQLRDKQIKVLQNLVADSLDK